MASAKAPILGKTTKADLPADLFTEDFHQSLVHETARADANSRRRGTASSHVRLRQYRRALLPSNHFG